MKKVPIFLLFALLISCNPECEELLTIEIDAFTKQKGQEILIKSSSPEFLIGKEITFLSSESSEVAAKGEFIEALGGVVTKIPAGVEGQNVQILIDDPDCGMIGFSSGLSVEESGFFSNNPLFIPPAPLEIVIPSPPVSFPPLVQNAWVSPQDLDYCIWFKFLPQIDANGDTIKVEINGKQVPKESRNLDPYNSSEFSVAELACGEELNTFYHKNPVFGVIDRSQNLIHFWIDRSNANGQNLGLEEFEGSFIDIDAAGYREEKTPNCDPGFDPKKYYLMLVTSKQTGRQLLLYQQAPL